MVDALHSNVGIGVAMAAAAFAFLKGDEPERVGGGACALGLLAAVLLHDDSRFAGPQWGLIAVDATLLVVYGALAWKSRRSWPFWATGLQSIIVMTHVLAMVETRPPPEAFHAVTDLAGYGVLLALVLGVLRAWKDRRALPAA